ncbi:MAG: right-handed parallel beta-helix repeat-containing protein [Actinomycetota bacterium]|nr:right-handed parallel beta-helix repeat-containing protein [Actinomycetota bacterium]
MGEHTLKRSTFRRPFVGAVLALTMVLAACGEERADDVTTSSAAPDETSGGGDTTSSVTDTMPAPDTTAGAEGVHNVPADYPTIQAAVDAAVPGDLVLIAAGTYNEAVNVETDDLTIRGLDRNEVVLDGEFELENGIRVLGAGGVAVENMTAINYKRNGFFWTGVDGFRGSYLTAYRTGDYGVYAFDSMNGQLEHIYAAGSPDAGVYIGECYPCNTVLTDTVSEHNGLGYSGTNAGGNLLIVNSVFNNNRAGIVPNSGSYELCYPQRETTIVGNLVFSNNQPDTPAIDVALLAMGNGIISAGGIRNDIERNLVWDHDKGGISLVPFLEENPNDDLPTKEEWELTCEESKEIALVDPGGALLWDSFENRVIGNVLEDNRSGDIIVASAGTDVSTLGNCFAGNTLTFTQPNNLETLAPCDAVGSGDWKDGEYNVALWLGEDRPPSVDWQTATLPPLELQENMPDAATAPAKPATDVPYEVDLDAITVPSKPS